MLFFSISSGQKAMFLCFKSVLTLFSLIFAIKNATEHDLKLTTITLDPI